MQKHMALLILLIALGFQCYAQDIGNKTYAELLGWPKGARVVIFHVDDVGMCHEVNAATSAALLDGVATSASALFPCAAVPEFMKMWQENPNWDIGVHLAVTCEKGNYRWGPLAGKPAVPSLVDTEGCMWARIADLAQKADPDQVEMEIRAQIQRCLDFGLKPTHLDSHVGALLLSPRLLARYMKVGIEMNIPVLMFGGHMQYIGKENPMALKMAKPYAKTLWDAGLPVIDDVNTGSFQAGEKEDKKEQVIRFLRDVQPGITEFVLHCAEPSDTLRYVCGNFKVREADMKTILDPDVKKVIQEEGIILTSWRELKERRGKVK